MDLHNLFPKEAIQTSPRLVVLDSDLGAYRIVDTSNSFNPVYSSEQIPQDKLKRIGVLTSFDFIGSLESRIETAESVARRVGAQYFGIERSSPPKWSTGEAFLHRGNVWKLHPEDPSCIIELLQGLYQISQRSSHSHDSDLNISFPPKTRYELEPFPSKIDYRDKIPKKDSFNKILENPKIDPSEYKKNPKPYFNVLNETSYPWRDHSENVKGLLQIQFTGIVLYAPTQTPEPVRDLF